MSGQLKKILGPGFGVAIVIGGTIGVGILRTPGTIASQLPDFWLILLCWLVGGLIVLISSSSYAELAAMMPRAGGMYNYVRAAFGNFPGFLTGWFDYIVNAMPPAYYAIVIAEYLILVLPGLGEYRLAVELSVITFFMGMNLIGTQTGSVFQQVTSMLKVLFFLVLIIACFLWTPDTTDPFHQVLEKRPEGGYLLAFFMALQFVTGAYNGWWNAAVFAEEDKDPGKNLPLSFFAGNITVIIIYVLINAALFHVIPVREAAGNPLVASQAAEIVFGRSGFIIMVIFALFTLINILNAYMMIPARILYGLSRDGFFLPVFTRVNNGGSPVPALLFSFVFQVILIVISSFDRLFSLGSFLGTIILGMAYCSVIILRKKMPDTPRPYKTWLYPWSTIVAIITSLALIFFFSVNDRLSLIVTLVLALGAYPLYLWIRKINHK